MPRPFLFMLAVFLLTFPATARAGDKVDYMRDIKPMLAKHCFECHGYKVQKGKLRLDTAELMRTGGRGGPALVPGKSAESALIHAVKGTNDFTLMPYKRPPLNDRQIRLLAEWIDQGAKAPAGEKPDDGRSHWAFQAPQRAPLPSVKDMGWVRNPIDRFILARLEKEGIRPSPEADRVTLLRRVYLDLIGLPPTAADVDAFLADARPDAYERLVDRLLASPHYGERWARHWLDLARYADTNGFTIDSTREIWKYRDWVIDALNKDLPFAQFVIEQTAGDMLPGTTVEQKIATGFHRHTLFNEEGGIDLEQFRVDAIADRVNTIGNVFLGLTLGCARCHDHKYDPISQKEYFQLFAFMNNQVEATLSLADPKTVALREAYLAKISKLEKELNPRFIELVSKIPEAERTPRDQEVQTILSLLISQRGPKQRQVLAEYFQAKGDTFKADLKNLAKLYQELPTFDTTLVLEELAKPRATTIHIAGDFTRQGEPVSTGFPSVLHPFPAIKGRDANRLDLARWLVDQRNPLIGRVTVNRLWQHYFGKGLVETENDFGLQGTPSSHPELLDWLAVELMDPASRSSFKAMHRLIVTSATYRQSSKSRPDLANIDAHNRFLARQTRLRLDAEIIRDSALAASGLLNRKIGGPSVFPPQPAGVYQFTQVPRTWPTSDGNDRYRRGLYTFFQRSAPYPALTVFDAPDGVTSCTRRIRSNTPLQALTLLNDPAYVEMSRGLAAKVLRDGNGDDRARLTLAFRLCLARSPSLSEMRRLEDFLAVQKKEFGAQDAATLLGPMQEKDRDRLIELAAWTMVGRVLLNLDEFITRE